MHDLLEGADLFVHRARPSWGLAIHTETRPDKVSFLFQDGTPRTFRSDYLHFFEAADKPRDVTEQVVDLLRAKAEGQFKAPKVAHADDVPSSSDQIRLFYHLFPEGFDDPGYLDKHRGGDGIRRRKSHHLAASEEAREVLIADEVGDAIENGEQQRVVDLMCDVMASTALAPRQTVREIRAAGAEAGVAEAIHGLLVGEAETLFDDFTRWMIALEGALGASPKWSMATALPALLKPDLHVAVKHSPFHREASWMAPSLNFARIPSAGVYRRVQRMCSALRETLIEEGLEPRDLLDVSAFIRIVMRPKNMKLVADLPDHG